ncbi:interferon-induced GTP-binding protein Mx2 [Niveomyces insectorum RCEF 264]|uniref:Interferon-induced GTP-binding protein Mx2 n=1 Tax=Niveomyces insectorum RCEF 264 TaxID=1081102 RepID=A0A167S0M8_9HYPO|nr:interferon-induced GTP-binding protein Mx2 [Niveomyces insectorum RCEF 264]
MEYTEHDDLGDQAILAKIDRLRETNVGTFIPLPQLVVVGDQSSGKSSALESLTGFSFPRAASLCTRYATQISCAREPEKKISVSIIPRPDADAALKARLLAFHRELKDMDNDQLADIFKEKPLPTKANACMGIRMNEGGDADNNNLSAFSEDILRINMSGPDQVHLTVIDVPGLFRLPTPGLTTESDVQLVRNIVKSYMKDSRTIILAVMPCNVDITTQEILTLAEQADPDGLRTMGVLTKPDLATEAATQAAVLDLVQGRRNPLKLGYCVIRNRGADDHTSTAADRRAAEAAFFRQPPWSSIQPQCGTAALKAKLRTLLFGLTKRELPQVQADMARRRRECTAALAALGPSRADKDAQQQYLVGIAARMQDVTKSALSGSYAGEALFQRDGGRLRLITRLIRLNEGFADTFAKRGHYQHFHGPSEGEDGEDGEDGEEGESYSKGEDDDDSSEEATLDADVPLDAYPELGDVVEDTHYQCPRPREGPITDLIQEVYDSSRGPELGTFSGTILAAVFDTATQKWEPLVLAHVGRAIVLVHDYLYRLLRAVCPDAAVGDALWAALQDELCAEYRRALDHARFLLDVERGHPPVTFDDAFNATLQAKRQARLVAGIEGLAVRRGVHDATPVVPLALVGQHAVDMKNTQHVCADILDTVESYYHVARTRFVDTVLQQAVYHFLLTGARSPLKVFRAERMLQLLPAELAAIAGEDAATRHERTVLTRKLESLNQAMAVLRT